jgi:hypothetical protein
MASQQWYFWEIVVLPFHYGKCGRLHKSSLLVFKMFQTEQECLKDAETQLAREKPDQFALKRESLLIIIKNYNSDARSPKPSSKHNGSNTNCLFQMEQIYWSKVFQPEIQLKFLV